MGEKSLVGINICIAPGRVPDLGSRNRDDLILGAFSAALDRDHYEQVGGLAPLSAV